MQLELRGLPRSNQFDIMVYANPATDKGIDFDAQIETARKERASIERIEIFYNSFDGVAPPAAAPDSLLGLTSRPAKSLLLNCSGSK